MHREGVLFKHLQLALNPVLRADYFAGPHVLLHCRDCHSRKAIESSVISLSFARTEPASNALYLYG